MDLLKSHKRRSRLSEAVYVALNIGFVVSIFLVAVNGLSIWIALGLVLLSKWRAFAVRPRFWFANLVANTVDIVVGLSIVVLMYANTLVGLPVLVWVQVFLAVLYVVWLLFIKPRSNRAMVAVQAGTSVFLGVTALSMVSYGWDAAFFVLAMWVIGFCAARHVLGSYDEPMTNLYALIVGLVFAEIGWVGYHWLFAYTVPGLGELKLSQLAIFLSLLCFVAERCYRSYRQHGAIQQKDVILPILLTGGVIVVLISLYNSLGSAGSV